MTLDEAIRDEAREARDRLIAAQHEVDRARGDYHHAIRRLHAAGGSMREIAEALGLSHQRVHQIVDEDVGRQWLMSPRRGGRRGRSPFHRFTNHARSVLAAAQEEARASGHDRVGSEHLLVGLFAAPDGVAARALAALGVEADAVRGAVRARTGEGEGTPSGQLRFRREAKKVLELALREALALGHNHLGTEHLLLALAAEGGTAAEILGGLGADEERVRAEVQRALAA